jgi:hypothetical protein
LFEDARVPPEAVLRVAVELVVMHRFDGDALARSYLDLAKRGHLRGERIDDLAKSLDAWIEREPVPSAAELRRMIERLPPYATIAKGQHGALEKTLPDYLGIVGKHNPRRA